MLPDVGASIGVRQGHHLDLQIYTLSVTPDWSHSEKSLAPASPKQRPLHDSLRPEGRTGDEFANAEFAGRTLKWPNLKTVHQILARWQARRHPTRNTGSCPGPCRSHRLGCLNRPCEAHKLRWRAFRGDRLDRARAEHPRFPVRREQPWLRKRPQRADGLSWQRPRRHANQPV
jgi:hypothetical protein